MILKFIRVVNPTTENVLINDLGITIAANSYRDINLDFDFILEILKSSDLYDLFSNNILHVENEKGIKFYKNEAWNYIALEDKLIFDSADGTLVVSPRFRRTDMNPKIEDIIFTAEGNSTTYYDWLVPNTLIYLQSIGYCVDSNVHEFADYIEFSVIDKTNITGMFDNFGLTVGVDILELSKNVKSLYCNKNEYYVFDNEEIMKLYPGLYLRYAYTNTGVESVKVRIRNFSHYVLDNLIY